MKQYKDNIMFFFSTRLNCYFFGISEMLLTSKFSSQLFKIQNQKLNSKKIQRIFFKNFQILKPFPEKNLSRLHSQNTKI
jgi:hypothetical protein